MVTDIQVRRLRKLSKTEKTKEVAAAKAGMNAKTARRYLADERLPSETKVERLLAHPERSFESEWEGIRQRIERQPRTGSQDDL